MSKASTAIKNHAPKDFQPQVPGSVTQPKYIQIPSGDTEALLNRQQVQLLTSLSRSSIYAAMAAGSFPKPVGIGGNRVAWKKSAILAWINSRG